MHGNAAHVFSFSLRFVLKFLILHDIKRFGSRCVCVFSHCSLQVVFLFCFIFLLKLHMNQGEGNL